MKPILLLVSHGERGGARDDRFAYDLVARLRRGANFSDVQTCFLSKEPSLKTVSAALPPGPVVIYPVFMANGYFVSTTIPRQLAWGADDGGQDERDVTVLAPLGLHPNVPQLVAELAVDAVRTAKADAGAYELLLVAHGSKHEPASRIATQDMADKLRARDLFAGVSVGFLEEPPFVSDQLGTIERPVIVAGLFAGQGMHGAGDVPKAVRASGRSDVILAGPLVEHPELAALVEGDIGCSPDPKP